MFSVLDGLTNVLVCVSIPASHQSSNLLEVVNKEDMDETKARAAEDVGVAPTED
jgi:hypothetical protein